MPNHTATIKSVRKNKKRRASNRYYGKTTRNLIKKLHATTNKKEAEELHPKTVSEVDKLAKRNLIHKKKAAHIKSQLAKKIASL
ncbi:MAG: 30S ribosomal protein S20 [Bacteroidetes bacterium]|nr:30S ribosomal protein S20 [Bacteroidota bacterium]